MLAMWIETHLPLQLLELKCKILLKNGISNRVSEEEIARLRNYNS